MLDVQVIDRPAAAAAVLEPVRARILAELVVPGSASSVATALGESRQRVNYHLRALERHGLVRRVGSRQRRGLTEQLLEATARAYVLSPTPPGGPVPDPARSDRLSAQYAIALAARLLREVAELARRADEARRPLATLALDADIRFASAADRAAFTAELTAAVRALTARYHDEDAPGGRWHRLLVAAHPRPATAPAPAEEA